MGTTRHNLKLISQSTVKPNPGFRYDTGASKTCINLETFKALFPHGIPEHIKSEHGYDNLNGASGKSLGL